MTDHADLLANLADIDPQGPLAAARHTRSAATKHAQGSYDVLFGQDDKDFPLAERYWFATRVAGWHGQPALEHHYKQLAGELSDTPRIQEAEAFARRLTFEPVEAAPQHIAHLTLAGWSERGIVTLAQLVAFVSFQSRLLAGFHLLQDQEVITSLDPVLAGRWHNAPLTASGKTALTAFTQQELGWEPWLAAKPLTGFTPDEQATLARNGHSDSDYFRLLGRNLPLLEQRTLTDKGIFYTAGGLPRAERELAATVVSKVNGCIYCASVHARKASQLSKQNSDVERLLQTAPGSVLSADQPARWQAIIDFSAALSVTPPRASLQQISALRDLALDELALLDLVQSTAFFAWANRLMLTLGEPFVPAE